MSRNYDNWERLVAAVMKREQIWQLCHQDSISTISASDDYSSDLELGLPVSLGNFRLTDTFEFVRSLPQSRRNCRTDVVRLRQDLQVSDQLCFGSGTTAVIKSLYIAKITEEEFEQRMAVLGNCVHENVATPWAYRSSDERKLIVYDYYSQGSVYDMFQGYGDRPNWESRARIAIGAARGIAHIHAQCGRKLAHGNIKSSNIFVNSQQYGCVSDFGWSEHELESPGAQKSDVYSFGMLLLELVTGRSVVHSHYIVNRLRLSEPDTFDFSGFCLFVDERDFEESELEKFPFVDSSIGSSPSVQQDLRKTLGVARRCLAELPQDRPTMSQVVFQLEKEGELSVVKTEQIHQHPISHHKSGGKKQIWDIILQFRRRHSYHSYHNPRQRKKKGGGSGVLQKAEKATRRMVSQQVQEGHRRIIFFEGWNLVFDLEDLLRASAEVLGKGKGTFGTTYKAVLEDATTVAVKRLEEVIVGRKDFEQQMVVFGNIRHANVAPLRAYYYSEDEKLMVYDIYSQGSVSMLLHAKRGENLSPLDWETRLKIGIGAARGIAHIHSQCGGKLVHGNIKSSNIFLNSQNYGCVSDLGLATLMSPASAPVVRSGYRAPEVMDSRKALQASDVYSYGVFLLELLTGKSPVHASGGEEVIHLVRWVNSVVREEWTGEVFDVELLRYPNVEEEMVSMLQIGLSCVARMPEQRPKMEHVVKMVEEIRVVANTGNNSSHGGTRSSSPNATPHVNEIGSSSATN